MIVVKSHSLGVDSQVGEMPERIVHTKRFKKYGLMCSLYIFIQMLLEDYIEIDEED